MFYASTNKTEESWSRMSVQKAKPSQNADEIMDRILKNADKSMSYETAVDFFKLQLGTWRRFYKQDDSVQVEETVTGDKLRVSRIKSLNIVFYIKEKADRTVDIRASFTDFEDSQVDEL
ncbi:MAG: hypothetical protein KBT11_01900 [Treponema sp.]|nr:hypothetical protein [Candidatus Treponema equifaecale]